MPAAPLATAADLEARGIVHDFDQVDTYLAVASSTVREAAGVHISQLTSTVDLAGYGDRRLKLPGAPIVEVVDVEIDGRPVDGWQLVDGALWRHAGWGAPSAPATVTVTYTHGLETVPDHIVDLVCAMVAATKAALDGDPDGLGLGIDNGRLQSVSIDGFAETYATSESAIAAVTSMTLPDRTRQWLALQFGGGASVVASR